MSVYRQVHIGGHHNVYCNGEKHMKFLGDEWGYAPLANSEGQPTTFRLVTFECDCDQWEKINSLMKEHHGILE